jgi:hypothetical protein
MQLVAVDADDARHHGAEREQVSADAAAQVEHGRDTRSFEAAGSMSRDVLRRRLLETVAGEQHRRCSIELVARTQTQGRLFGCRGDKFGRPPLSKSLCNGEVVTRVAEQLRRGQQLPKLANVQRRMPASG